jgi:hypothetical protein
MIESDSFASKTISTATSADDGKLIQLNSSGEIPEALVPEMSPLRLDALSADPDDPADGSAVLWISDGTGTGDDGDVLMKITVGATTKTITLVDWSAS